MAFFVGTSLTTAIHVLIGSDVMALPTAMAIAGVTLLLLASVQLTRGAQYSAQGQSCRDRLLLRPAAPTCRRLSQISVDSDTDLLAAPAFDALTALFLSTFFRKRICLA